MQRQILKSVAGCLRSRISKRSYLEHNYMRRKATSIDWFSPHLRFHSTDLSDLRIMLLCNQENGLTKLVKLYLQERGVQVKSWAVNSAEEILEKSKTEEYDIIVCPFLTKRVPEQVWGNKEKPCLIVHPGIVGDRGMSSLDWAIEENQPYWGVTVLQAAQEMDSGDIWSTAEFPFPQNTTKTNIYNGPIADKAVLAVVDALQKFKLKQPPLPLDYSDPNVRGTLKSSMTRQWRKLDWAMTAEETVRKMWMSDTQPGCQAKLSNLDRDVIVFGGHVQDRNQSEEIQRLLDAASVGDVVAQKHGAVLVKAGDGNGVWTTHMKEKRGKDFLKLPATTLLSHDADPLPVVQGPSGWEEIVTTSGMCGGMVDLIHFDFYNGAMSTEQCRRLQSEIEKANLNENSKVIAILGGQSFFSNGVHLNVIEGAADPAEESWANINAIDDLIKSFVTIRDKVVVSALQSGAGAGGVMMAAAADLLWARQNILLTPTYRAMHLYGSEYWTYFLPKRVGHEVAQKLTGGSEAILTQTAESLGLVDKTFGSSSTEFLGLLPIYLSGLVNSPTMEKILREKAERDSQWEEMVEEHRNKELNQIWKCFQSDEYHNARRAFVFH